MDFDGFECGLRDACQCAGMKCSFRILRINLHLIQFSCFMSSAYRSTIATGSSSIQRFA